MEADHIIRDGHNISVKYGAVTVQPANDAAVPEDSYRRIFKSSLVFVSLTVGTVCIAVGSNFVQDCPAQTKLPISLIAFGCICIISRLINCVNDYRSIFENLNDTPRWLKVVNFCFFVAAFILFWLVCYWISRVNPTVKPEECRLDNYCHTTLYYFANIGCLIGLGIIGFILAHVLFIQL